MLTQKLLWGFTIAESEIHSYFRRSPTMHHYRIIYYWKQFLSTNTVVRTRDLWTECQWFKSDNGHWWCQEGFPTAIASVLHQ